MSQFIIILLSVFITKAKQVSQFALQFKRNEPTEYAIKYCKEPESLLYFMRALPEGTLQPEDIIIEITEITGMFDLIDYQPPQVEEPTLTEEIIIQGQPYWSTAADKYLKFFKISINMWIALEKKGLFETISDIDTFIKHYEVELAVLECMQLEDLLGQVVIARKPTQDDMPGVCEGVVSGIHTSNEKKVYHICSPVTGNTYAGYTSINFS